MPLHYAINHDPRTWSQPGLFRPQRFLDNCGELKADTYLFPFQVGKRRCIGEELGRATTQLTLATLLQNFTLELEPGVNIWTEPEHDLNLTPPKYRVKMIKRR